MCTKTWAYFQPLLFLLLHKQAFSNPATKLTNCSQTRYWHVLGLELLEGIFR